MALRQGWTEEELTEVLLHLSGYVGVPIIRESMMVATKTFTEFRTEKAAEKRLTD
jgi:4-carboxymuconolactone decarboxylase